MKFSIIIITHNRSWAVKEAIDSVLSQTFKDFELIVVDDGSTDNTLNVLNEYGNRITVVKQKNSGPSIARNSGALKGKGDYLLFLDDDDIFFPYTLGVYERIIAQKQNPPFLAGQAKFFNGREIPEAPVVKDEISFVTYPDYFSKDRSTYTTCSMIVIRRDIFNLIGGFRTNPSNFFPGHDDFYILLKVAAFGPAILVVEPIQFGYRLHSSNSVKNINSVLKNISSLIDELKNDKTLKYHEKKFPKFAIIGGTSIYWILKAFEKGIIVDSIKLLMKSMPMILTAITKKTFTKLRKKVSIETIRI